MMIERATWPHTISDIYKALDNIWGVVGAYDLHNNLMRLEKSISSPITYILTSFEGNNEKKITKTESYAESQKDQAVNDFAKAIGFTLEQP